MPDASTNSWLEIVKAGLLILGGGTLAKIITPFYQRKKTYAEAQKTLSEATLEYAESLKHDLVSVLNRLRQSEEDNERTFQDLKATRQKLEEAENKRQKLEDIVRICAGSPTASPD
jgi:hypothetical protein